MGHRAPKPLVPRQENGFIFCEVCGQPAYGLRHKRGKWQCFSCRAAFEENMRGALSLLPEPQPEGALSVADDEGGFLSLS